MATGVYFRKLSSAELALEAIQEGKVLYNYETKKIYVDSGTPTATRYEFYDFIGINTATVYSASSTYAIGAYCIYGDLLYRCTTAITVAEAWTIGHWTQVNVANEITYIYNIMGTIPYSTSSTYIVGSLVVYNNYLYKCNTAITTGETFNPSKWTLTNIISELTTINGTVSVLSGLTSVSWSLNKIGNVVNFSFSFNANIAHPVNTVFFTLPSGFRPTTGKIFAMMQAGDGIAFNTSLSTIGTVYCANNPLVATKYYSGSIMFII